jgi:hypothetical protein
VGIDWVKVGANKQPLHKMETTPNGAGFRPEFEDVPIHFADDLERGLADEDLSDEYRENLTATSDLNNPANFI